MTKIFMSYRREDSSLEAEFIRDRLVRKMKNTEVFYDLDSVSVGRDFKKQIDHFVAAADFFLALIGGSWLTVNDANGQRRLDDPGDFVRLEIESALQRGMPIIPVLLNGARMPEAAQLPDSLRGLVACKPHLVRLPPDFKPDVNELARMLIGLDRNRRERLNASNGPTAAPAPSAASPLLAVPANIAELADRFPTAVEIIWPNRDTYAVIGKPLAIAWRAAPGFGVRFERFEIELLSGGESVATIEIPAAGDCRSLFWNVPQHLPRGKDYRIRLVACDNQGKQKEAMSDRFAMPARRSDVFRAVGGTILAAVLIGTLASLALGSFWPLLLGVSLGTPISVASLLLLVYPPARRIILATVAGTIVVVGLMTFFSIRTGSDVIQYLTTSALLGTVIGALIAGSRWKLGETNSLAAVGHGRK